MNQLPCLVFDVSSDVEQVVDGRLQCVYYLIACTKRKCNENSRRNISNKCIIMESLTICKPITPLTTLNYSIDDHDIYIYITWLSAQ